MKCLNCGIELSHRNSKYCSNKCQRDCQYKTYINKWFCGEVDGSSGKYGLSNHIERYIKHKFGNKCSKCGWDEVNKFTGKTPLEIEHIDGNPYNHKEDNLDLLCPNCHSLTSTYKGANLGNGRVGRKKYSSYANENEDSSL